jgi:hypothetical protein
LDVDVAAPKNGAALALPDQFAHVFG